MILLSSSPTRNPLAWLVLTANLGQTLQILIGLLSQAFASIEPIHLVHYALLPAAPL